MKMIMMKLREYRMTERNERREKTKTRSELRKRKNM
jgi:hypothetical protein